MAATKKAKQHRTRRPPETALKDLTPAHRRFRELLAECLPKERLFIKGKLDQKSNTQAAIDAGYAPRSADVTGSQLLTRARVWDAYQAGLEAAGFGPQDILQDIQALRTFDRSKIERKVKQAVMEMVERPAREHLHELKIRLKAVREHINGMDARPDDKTQQKTLEVLGDRLIRLEKEILELVEALAVNPAHTVVVPMERLVTNRVLDFDLAEQQGYLKFIKGRRPGRYGEIIELHDWVTGVEMGAKALGVFRDRVEMTGKDGESLGTATVIVLPSNGRERADE